MSNLNSNELISYLEAAIKACKDLQRLWEGKNKTKKVKAILSMLKIVEARIDSGLKYAKAGGELGLPLSMQQDLYNPILEYLVNEI